MSLPSRRNESEKFDVRYKGKIITIVVHFDFDDNISFKDLDGKDLDLMKMMNNSDFKTSFSKCIKMFDSQKSKDAATLFVAMHVDTGEEDEEEEPW